MAKDNLVWLQNFWPLPKLPKQILCPALGSIQPRCTHNGLKKLTKGSKWLLNDSNPDSIKWFRWTNHYAIAHDTALPSQPTCPYSNVQRYVQGWSLWFFKWLVGGATFEHDQNESLPPVCEISVRGILLGKINNSLHLQVCRIKYTNSGVRKKCIPFTFLFIFHVNSYIT